MINVLKVLEELEKTSSRNEKEKILKENKDNTLLKSVFYYTYNPYLVYGIGKKSIKPIKPITDIGCYTIFDLLDYLLEHNTGSNNDVLTVNRFLGTLDELSQKWFIRIILKDLRIGATASTINKVFPNLIPVFDVMLAKKYWDYEDKVKGLFIVTTKLDGVRCVIIKDMDEISMWSRQGKQFLGFQQLINEAKKLPDGVYDGELLLRNDTNIHSKDLYSETMKVVSKDGIKENVEFHIFDTLPLQEFKNGKSTLYCMERKIMLKNILESNNFTFLKEVPILYIGDDKSKIIELLDKITNKGGEGVMVNIANAPYKCSRTDVILKVKKMQSCDCCIKGFEEGDGKLSNTLGAIVIDYKGNEVRVGSGYSDSDREYIWNNKESLLNTIVEVQYFEETKNSKNDNLSLRFPVFLRLRSDKITPSYN